MGAASGSDHRWQGYSHQELYDMLHSGPGSSAAGAVADEWSGMANALADIRQEINTGVAGSGATWVGAAGDSARGALGPLGDWAQQASTAADVMRISTELQGDLLAKARADMPAPVPVPQQPNQIGQLFTTQVDYEVTELSSQLAAQQAYQVMAQYEAATNDNTSTLGDFGDPPMLVVDTSPITDPGIRGTARSVDPPRGASRLRTASTRAGSESTARGADPDQDPAPAKSRSGGTESAAPEVDSSGPEAPTKPTLSTVGSAPAVESTPGAGDTGPDAGAVTGGAVAADSSAGAGTTNGLATAPSAVAPAATGQSPSPTVAARLTPTTPNSAGTPVSASVGTSATDRKSSGNGAEPTPRTAGTQSVGAQSVGPNTRFTGAVVPAARRPDEDDDADAVHESKYLIEADDIYGAHQTYTPPVIGESPRRR